MGPREQAEGREQASAEQRHRQHHNSATHARARSKQIEVQAIPHLLLAQPLWRWRLFSPSTCANAATLLATAKSPWRITLVQRIVATTFAAAQTVPSMHAGKAADGSGARCNLPHDRPNARARRQNHRPEPASATALSCASIKRKHCADLPRKTLACAQPDVVGKLPTQAFWLFFSFLTSCLRCFGEKSEVKNVLNQFRTKLSG